MNNHFDEDGIPTLKIGLDSMTVDELKKLAALTGQKVPGRKEDIAALIVQHLAGERLREVWEGLDELQRAAVAEAVHSSSPQFEAGLFRAKYGRDPDRGSGGEYRSSRKPSALCFFFYKNAMPADLKARLLKFVPAPRQTTVGALDRLPAVYERPFVRWNEEQRTRETGTEEVPLALHETERVAQRELLSVLRLVDAGKVAVSDKTRRPSASTVDAITAILDGGDYYPQAPVKDKWYDENSGPIRAFAWPLLIQAGGLAQLSGTRLQLTKAGRKALSEPAAGTIRTLWTKWMDTTILDELARVECVKGQTGKGKRGLTAVSGRREAVADSLAECPPGGWIATEEFFRYMQATGNDFEVTRDAWNLYIGELQYGSLGYDGSAAILTPRYILSLLLEYAATLGVIDVALIPPAGARRDFRGLWGTDDLPFFSRYDGLMYFRLTPLGAHCLGVETDYQPAPVEVRAVLRIQPNLEIAATSSDLEQSDRLALNAYATPVSDLVWRLETGKLLAAIEEGRQVEEIRAFLAARSGAALPDTATHLLDDVADRITQVYDRGLARLVECADPALAGLIANDPRTRKHCMRAGERHLVVTASSEAAFRRALRDAGYLLATGDNRPAGNRATNPRQAGA
ncbi:MAG TPA: helicase-associated domain-containing protein [Candidatus Acidoferrales bacterium]|nr:helicase-associated domain-containing protein [Candidatus Acidoferrales bacterium]